LAQALLAQVGGYRGWVLPTGAGAERRGQTSRRRAAQLGSLGPDIPSTAAGMASMTDAEPAKPAKPAAAPRCIFTYWHGEAPGVVLRCIQSLQVHNPGWRVVALTPANLREYMGEKDWPAGCSFELATREVGDIRQQGAEAVKLDSCAADGFFESVQRLSDWVRLTVLYKHGGVWLDASCFCTAPVEAWLTEPTKVTLFTQRVCSTILENWAIAAPPRHWLVGEWRAEMARALESTPYGTTPLAYIEDVFASNAIVRRRWGTCKTALPGIPGIPYLWCHLTLQVVISRVGEEALAAAVHARSSADGPMARRHAHSQSGAITDKGLIAELIAEDLATKPLDQAGVDRFFIKMVGPDRRPIQARLDAGAYTEGSALWSLAQMEPRPIR